MASDAGLVVVAVLPAVLMQPSADFSARAWWLLAGFEVVACAALLVRRHAPVTAFLTVLIALVFAATWGASQHAKLSPLVVLSLAIALYSMGSSGTNWRRTILAVLGGCALVVVGVWVNHQISLSANYRGGADVVGVLAPMPLAWALGFAARTHRVNLQTSVERVHDVLREQGFREQRAAEQERVRIAREMHDVVAHSITLLVVRAETLRARGSDLPEWARGEVHGLASSGRQASSELRDLLRVLRGPDDDGEPSQPMPGLADLPSLMERSRAAGMTVDARISVETEALPRPVQLAAYRIVQEALTNARRHAPGARVTISLTESGGWLRCEIVNAGSTSQGTSGLGSGLGLVSMRERVDALGGRLQAGPLLIGGFEVVADLPLRATPTGTAYV